MKRYHLFRVIFIALSISFNHPLATTQAALQQEVKTSQITHDYGSIKVIDGKIILGDRLQEELQQKITLAKVELQDISKKLAIDYSEKITINYFHLGQNNWEIKFSFGGILLNTSELIILSTEQIFTLKKFFQATDFLIINNHKYQTTSSMVQLGPILHQGN